MKPNMHTQKWLKVATAFVLVAMITALIASSTTTANAQATPPAPQPDAKTAVGNAVKTAAAALLSETATTLNVKPGDVLAALAGGTTTLADYVKANSKDANALSTIEAAAATDLTTKINDAVTAGKIKQKGADRLIAALPTALDKLANTPWPNQKKDIFTKIVDGRALKLLIDETATEAKIDEKTILADLRAGQTLAQIATANNADPSAIVSASVATATKAINRVAQTGKISQDQATTLTGNLQQVLTKYMNMVNPLDSPKSKRNGKANGSDGLGAGSDSQATPDATADAGSAL